jgi:hypothetical protein
MRVDFAPYNRALKLKQLGFDGPCFGRYYNEEFELDYGVWNSLDVEHIIATPTFSQAFRWFRENYNLFHEINVDKTTEPKFAYTIIEYELAKFFEGFKEDVLAEYLYYKYEEAELACLDKLIEIVKLTKQQEQ